MSPSHRPQDGPDRVLVMVVAVCVWRGWGGGGVEEHRGGISALVKQSVTDIMSTVVSILHGMTIGAGHTWSSTETCYGG